MDHGWKECKMAYTKNTWLPRIGTGLNKFTDQNGNEWTLTSAPTEVQQAGTPFTADWMNHIEDGIYNAAARADISSNPNLLINGGFTVWQRGESFTVGTSRMYTGILVSGKD